MVLFSLLGVIALLQRERKKVSNAHSGQEENADQSDAPPPVESPDVQEVDVYWSEDLSMEEPVNGLLEVDNDRSEDPTLEGPITSRSQVDDDWSDEVFQDLVGDLSEWSADVLHALDGVMGKFNSVQTPVPHDSSDDVQQDTVGTTSDSIDDVQEATVSATSDSSDMSDSGDDVPQSPVCDMSESSDMSGSGVDVRPSTVCDTSESNDQSDSGDDVPRSPVCDMSDSRDDVPEATVCETSSCSDDVLQATVCPTSDCSDGIPSAFLCALSYCSDGVHPSSYSEMSHSSSDGFLEATISGTSSYSDDVPPSSCCDMSYCTSDDVLETTACQTEDTVAPQTNQQQDETTVIVINSCRYGIGRQLGKGGFGTVYAATRLDDGFQVVLKFVSNRNKKFFLIDGYSKPLPLEVALLILASQDPPVPEIVELLDWDVEPDHYVLVLEHPVSFVELNRFVLRQIMSLEEDVARVIMRQAVCAAQTCCQRGVLHRDIKMENILINPETLEVKLIDFGCGDFLNDTSYTSFAGTREYCPPEYLMTGEYHGEPATVWSLGILLFALMCGDFPNIQDLKKINNNTWAKDGLSEECCDMIRCCLQIDPKQRIELEKVSLHNWIKNADKEK